MKFKVGDRIVLVNTTIYGMTSIALAGATATVTGIIGSYVKVVWDRDNDLHRRQVDGKYLSERFELAENPESAPFCKVRKNLCPHCNTPMQTLFTSQYCPKGCDKP